MIFLDTSGLYALADRDDAMHEAALEAFNVAIDSNETLVTHSYVLVETAALMQNRLGKKTAMAFLEEANRFDIVWVTGGIHAQAVDYMIQHDKPRISLVDAVSFVVMQSEKITRYIGFDKHFDDAGMKKYKRREDQ